MKNKWGNISLSIEPFEDSNFNLVTGIMDDKKPAKFVEEMSDIDKLNIQV